MSDSDLKNDESLVSNAYWKDKLTSEEYRICREKGTERPFSGEYNDFKGEGAFACRCCGAILFDAGAKFDSGSGWPSFSSCHVDAVAEHTDGSHGMARVEITCSQCDSHLGHVFPDGPAPTGLRYCVNSLSIKHSLLGDAQ